MLAIASLLLAACGGSGVTDPNTTHPAEEFECVQGGYYVPESPCHDPTLPQMTPLPTISPEQIATFEAMKVGFYIEGILYVWDPTIPNVLVNTSTNHHSVIPTHSPWDEGYQVCSQVGEQGGWFAYHIIIHNRSRVVVEYDPDFVSFEVLTGNIAWEYNLPHIIRCPPL